MTNDRPALTAAVLGILRTIAPEVEPEAIDPARPLRHQVDLDSMDWLNFLVAMHERLSVSIPEADYTQLVTLDNMLDYLLARLGPAGG